MFLEKRWSTLSLAQWAMLVLLSMAGGVLLSGIITHLAGDGLNPAQRILVMVVCSMVGFQGAAVVWTHVLLSQNETTWWETFGLSRAKLPHCAVTALFALPLLLGGVFLLGKVSELGLNELHEWLHWSWLKPAVQPAVQLLMGSQSVALTVVQGLVAMVIAPVGEEIMFRGVLYTAIRQRGSRMLATGTTAVLFASIHFYPVGFLPLMFLSIVQVALYERTQSLLAPICLHSLFNTTNFILIVVHPKWAEELIKP